MGATASLESKALSVEPGAEASVRMRVLNTGQVVDEFTLEVLGDAATWATVTPLTIPLFPGKDAIAMITFRPPRTPQTTAGQMPFGVRVQSREDPAGSVVEEGALTVGTFANTTAELVPKNSRGSRSGVHEVAVDNRGNGSMQAALTAGDQDKLLEYSFNPTSLVVAPGTAGFSRLRVRTKQPFWRGSPKSRAFQVQVQPDGQQPIRLDGALVQGPLLAPWMVPVAAGVIVALIALALLWFLAVKPGIESVARNAVTTPTPVGSTGGGGSTPGGGGATPTASSGTGPAGGINFSQRLAPGANAYKAPANTTLYVTDLVFQNPQSESGIESLERDSAVLLQENLINYRDLDYHFVTPIQVNPNQTISLAGPCSACSVLITGYEKTS